MTTKIIKINNDERKQSKTWFENIFGFKEDPVSIYKYFNITNKNGIQILNQIETNKQFIAGSFTTQTLQNLQQKSKYWIQQHSSNNNNTLKKTQINVIHKNVYDILEYHSNPEDENIHVTFQCASQFNCLEFPSEKYIPELGITNYVYDSTQGPACAVACPAGTLFRNYFINIGNQIGQNKTIQINNLDVAENILHPYDDSPFWNVKNGYVFSTTDKLNKLNTILNNETISKQVLKSIKVGIQSNTQVLMKNKNEPLINIKPKLVTQIYCSAISCSYSHINVSYWELFACIILNSIYEATLWSALLYAPICQIANSNHYKVYLTFIGGGAFGNKMSWIINNMAKSIKEFISIMSNTYGIVFDIVICHYRSIDPKIKNQIDSIIYN